MAALSGVRVALSLLALALIPADAVLAGTHMRKAASVHHIQVYNSTSDHGGEAQGSNETARQEAGESNETAPDAPEPNEEGTKQVRPTVPAPHTSEFKRLGIKGGIPEHASPEMDVKVHIVSKEGDEEEEEEEEDEGEDEDQDNAEIKARRKLDADVVEAKFNVVKAKKEYVKWKTDLEENQKKQYIMEHEIEALQNQEGFGQDMEKAVAKVQNETQTVHMAAFLGEMWKEMRTLAAPFFVEHLENRTIELKKQERFLEKKFDAAKEALKDAVEELEDKEDERDAAEATSTTEEPEKEDAEESSPAEEETESAEVAEKPVKKTSGTESAAAKKSLPTTTAEQQEDEGDEAAPSQAKYTAETMPSVSAAMTSIIILLVHFFVIYTAVAVVRTMNQFSADGHQSLENLICAAANTLFYAPMFCALFLGTRMRAIQLAKGETEKYRLPQSWVQVSFYICVAAIVGQTFMVLIMGFATRRHIRTDSDGAVLVPETLPKNVAMAVHAIRYTFMVLLFLGALTVVIGTWAMKAPEELWGDENVPVSPSLVCTEILATFFLATYLGFSVTSSIKMHATSADGTRVPKKIVRDLHAYFGVAQYAINQAPMLCILFLGARVRALQIDPVHGHPQRWAQLAFYCCTFGVVAQVVVAIVLPLVGAGQVTEGASEGEMVITFRNTTMTVVASVLRYCCVAMVWGGALIVVASIFLLGHPTDPELTPPVPPALQCVVYLTSVYVLAYTALFVSRTVTAHPPSRAMARRLVDALAAGTKTLLFAPMLAALFLAARIRANQLTMAEDGSIPPDAGPQPWAQACMHAATFALIIQYIIVICVPWFMGTGIHEALTTDDGMYKPPGKVGIALVVAQYACMLVMYASACAVIAAIFLMTPESLPPYAA